MKTKLILTFPCIVAILFATSLWAADVATTAAPKEGEAGEKSLTELNKEDFRGARP